VNELDALLLGVVQGLTEFLPVSSSGHLVMLQTLLGIREDGVIFEITVHVATLVSVLIFYRARIASLTTGVLRREPDAVRYLAKLVVATLPAVVVVLLAGDFVEAQFDSPSMAGFCLIITGLILWTTRATSPRATGGEPSFRAALLIGCAQAFALLPGISRSGSTVAMALALGVRPVQAAEFSFLMSVIAITGAALRAAPDLALVSADSGLSYAIGGVAAGVSGVGAIWLFVRMLENRALHRYAYYTWGLGSLFLIWLTATGQI